MKVIRVLLVCLASASCSSENGTEFNNYLIDQCLQDPVKEIALGRGGVSTSFYISEQCIYDESVHGSMGHTKLEGYLNAVFCPEKNGECGKGKWMSLLFSYYIHPEMLRQNTVADKYIEDVNGFSVFEYKYGMRKLLPNNDQDYYLACSYGDNSQYHGCMMHGGVYKERVKYRIYYRGLLERYDFHRINNQINSFIMRSVRYEG